MALVTVAFACNDDRGDETLRCEAINFVSEEHGNADLVCQMPRGRALYRVRDERGTTGVILLRIGRRTFRAISWTRWYGNMAWNATQMTLTEAERLLRYLLACGDTVEGYDCDGPFATIIEEHERASRPRREG